MKRYETGCGARTKLIAFCVLAAALMASLPARAETIFLKCDQGAELGSDRYANFTVDLTNSTVDNHPAKIDATSIDWQLTGNAQCEGSSSFCASEAETFVSNYHIDRTSGAYMRTTEVTRLRDGLVSRMPSMTGPCTVSSAPATKF